MKNFKLISIAIAIIDLLSVSLLSAQPFNQGERIEYRIYASGFIVGYQTIEVEGIDHIKNRDVWVINGRSRTSPFLSIFYRLDDKWKVYMDKESLLPVVVKKDVVEGRRKDFLTYNIDQKNKIVTIVNKRGIKIKEIKYKNNLFDLFSLIYFFRAKPDKFTSDFIFDFLEEKSVRTVHFKRDRDLKVIIPSISRRKPINALSITQVGGIGINIIVGKDNVRLPLKMVVPSRLPHNKRLNVIFSIHRFTPGNVRINIPNYYKKIIRLR